MIRDDTKQTIKFIVWVIIIAIIFYVANVLVFYKAGSNSRDNQRQIVQVANKKTPIRNVDRYYHLDRGVNSYSIKGTDKKGKNSYYFVYLPHSKKAYLYPANKGVGENYIKKTFKQNHANTEIKKINLGWYEGKPVWEVTFSKNQNLGYILYDFHNGKVINEVDNL